jgi:hypothetical protein
MKLPSPKWLPGLIILAFFPIQRYLMDISLKDASITSFVLCIVWAWIWMEISKLKSGDPGGCGSCGGCDKGRCDN